MPIKPCSYLVQHFAFQQIFVLLLEVQLELVRFDQVQCQRQASYSRKLQKLCWWLHQQLVHIRQRLIESNRKRTQLLRR